jgi:hypothetical protein
VRWRSRTTLASGGKFVDKVVPPRCASMCGGFTLRRRSPLSTGRGVVAATPTGGRRKKRPGLAHAIVDNRDPGIPSCHG